MKFDCKVATVTMKPGAALSEKDVTAAIKAAGWGVKEWKVGDAIELVNAHLFRITGTKAEENAALSKRLKGSLKGAQEVVIDSAGFATVIAAKDSPLTTEAVIAALKEVNGTYGIADFQSKVAPKTVTTYEVTVPTMGTTADGAKVRAALRAIGKVIAINVFPETHTAQIKTNEPCAKIGDEVTEVLDASGFAATVKQVGAEPDKKAPEAPKEPAPAKDAKESSQAK
jgi:copper chaperone CopZ